MNEEAISYIMQKMSNCLDNSQMIILEKTLEEALRGEDKLHLEKYLSSRNDENPALFVTIRNPHRRLKAGGVGIMLWLHLQMNALE